MKIFISFFIFFILISILSGYNNYRAYNNEKSVAVPIIMYHSVLKDKTKTDKYTITPLSLEKDLIYLKENNYNTIFVSDLIDYVYYDKTLPDNPIIITFDDGFLNNLTYAFPLLEKYNMKATISIIGCNIDEFSKKHDPNVNYAYLTWDDIKELNSSGVVEIANHSYDMHDFSKRLGSMKKFDESIISYTITFKNDLKKLEKCLYEYTNITCKVFTYPYGLISKESVPIINDLGFLASLTCEEKINHITKNPDCLYLMGRFNRHGKLSTENFMKKIKES